MLTPATSSFSAYGQRQALPLEQVAALNQPMHGPSGPLPSASPVVIVGAGPMGLTAANLLGSYGVSVVLVEKSTETSSQPKAIVIDDEYMRLLDELHLADTLLPHTSPPFGIHFISPTGYEFVKAKGVITANGFGNRNAISQPVFEKVLLERALQYPTVTVRFGIEVVDLTDHPTDRVTVVASDGSSALQTISAEYVMACDGAKSFVRQHLNIDFRGRRIDQPHLVVDLAEFPDQSPYSRFFCDPRRPLNSIPGPYGGRRVEFMLTEKDDVERVTDPQAVRELFARHTPYPSKNLQIVRTAVYGFSARVASKLKIGRIFLLGDAAHVMPPFGASGMNTGARDVKNLCWKLDAVLGGRMTPAVLATFEPERRPHIEAVVRYSDIVGRLANIRSWPLALGRDAAFALVRGLPSARRYLDQMRYMPTPQIEAGPLVAEPSRRSLAGRLFPWLEGRTPSGHRTRVDDLCASHHAVVGLGAPAAAVERLAHAIRELDPAAASISIAPSPAGQAVSDAAVQLALGEWPASLMKAQGGILLVRPDRYVAIATDPAQADNAFNRYLGATMP